MGWKCEVCGHGILAAEWDELHGVRRMAPVVRESKGHVSTCTKPSSRVISERSAIWAQKLAPRVRRVVSDCEIRSYNLLILGFLMAVRWLAEAVGGFPTCRRYPAATVKNELHHDSRATKFQKQVPRP